MLDSVRLFLLLLHLVRYSPTHNTAMMMLVLFFESICFPTIFTLGLRGLGRHTKKGASYIVASLIGAAIVPPILLATADYFDDTGRAQFINTIFFVVGVTFAFGVNFHKGTKALVDGFSDSKVGLEGKDPEAGMRKERQTEARGGEEKVSGDGDSTEKAGREEHVERA